jgi:hypothetical protein
MKHALAGALAMLLAMGLVMVVQNQTAGEREAALEARADSSAQVAREAESRRTADSVAHHARLDSLAALRAAERDSARAREERSRIRESAAENRSERLRVSLTAEQARELDAINDFWREALREERHAHEATKRGVTLAEAEAAVEKAFRIRETRRADRWKAAYDDEHELRTEIQKPDLSIFGLSLNLGCTGGASATYDVTGQRVGIGPGLTCGLAI